MNPLQNLKRMNRKTRALFNFIDEDAVQKYLVYTTVRCFCCCSRAQARARARARARETHEIQYRRCTTIFGRLLLLLQFLLLLSNCSYYNIIVCMWHYSGAWCYRHLRMCLPLTYTTLVLNINRFLFVLLFLLLLMCVAFSCVVFPSFNSHWTAHLFWLSHHRISSHTYRNKYCICFFFLLITH